MEVIKDAGFDPFFFLPDWRDPRPHVWATDMVDYANQVVDSRKNQAMVLGGFSCGALISVLAVAKIEQDYPKIMLEGHSWLAR